MNYQTRNHEIRVEDIVMFNGAKAVILALGFSGKYSLEAPREDWEKELGLGLLLRFENGALVSLEEPNEDLEFIDRKHG